MPRPVVPIFWSPRRPSRARSSAPCDGRISAALSANRKFCGEMSSPFSRIVSISATSAQGSTTTPLPMIDSLPRRTTPEGSRLSLYSVFPTRRVWPALWPPWKRTTTSARSDNQSTILPLPSSPHWAPTTTTLPISASSADRHPGLALQNMAAAEAARLRPPVALRFECGDRDPARLPQGAGSGAIGTERQQHATRRERCGQYLQDRIGIEGEAGRRLRCRGIAGLITPAAAELAERAVGRRSAREKRKADPGVVLEATVFDRVDRHFELGSRHREPVEHGTEPCPLGARPTRQLEAVERGKRRGSGTRGKEQALQELSRLACECSNRCGVLVVEGGTQRGRILPADPIGLGDCRHQCWQSDIHREVGHAECRERRSGNHDRLDIGGRTRGADQFGADLADLPLRPDLGAPDPQHLAGVAEAPWPWRAAEPS